MIDKLSWVTIYPELVLLIMGCFIALTDFGRTNARRSRSYGLTLGTLAVVVVLTAWQAWQASTLVGSTYYGFGDGSGSRSNGLVVMDAMGSWLKCFAALALMVGLVYGRPYAADRNMLRNGGELFTLSLFALLGMFVMISGNNFVMIYLGLELLTLSSYALVALRRDHPLSSEAAMKYFVLGAMASGFLLYGLSMMYGATGSLDINAVYASLSSHEGSPQVLVFGLVFVVAGLAFKIGAVPFHMWVPDVYQGAPTAVTLLIGSAPELAAFAIIIRLLVVGFQPLTFDWQQMLALLAIASLLVGNLAAIAQTNLKRMLAYSAIAQMGFMLLGLTAGIVNGDASNAWRAYSASMFYVITYVLTTLATFGIIMLLAREGFESEEIADLAGLNRRSPLYAGVMAIAMFSLAGIPPMVGFYAKLMVLQALINSGQMAYIVLAVFAVLISLVAAFYYLRVVKVMYFDEPSSTAAPAAIVAPRQVRVVLALNGALILILGIVPGGLMSLCMKAIINSLTTTS
ncbi:MAG: NADH-quinone oxidoreductase subunit NuoN [Burkholderiaceae bacterium]|jgi:NADH-quinone oxidoreductase subunit N|nr:NADH-quinone oxidoreductase subunit NuoN [Burkholderiaceae bacterium]